MKLIVILLLTFLALVANSQVSHGSMQVQNLGSHYRISLNQAPVNNIYPRPDSASLRVVVVCPKTNTFEVNFIPLTGTLDYKLGGVNYIATTVIWWRNGVKKSQTSQPTVCGFFTNPLDCFHKI